MYHVCVFLSVEDKKEFITLYLNKHFENLRQKELYVEIAKFMYVPEDKIEELTFNGAIKPSVFSTQSVSANLQFVQCSTVHKCRKQYSRSQDKSYLFTFKSLNSIVSNVVSILKSSPMQVKQILIVGCQEPINILIMYFGITKLLGTTVQFVVVERLKQHADALIYLIGKMSLKIKVEQIDFNFFKVTENFTVAINFVNSGGLKTFFALKLLSLCSGNTEILGTQLFFDTGRQCLSSNGIRTKRNIIKIVIEQKGSSLKLQQSSNAGSHYSGAINLGRPKRANSKKKNYKEISDDESGGDYDDDDDDDGSVTGDDDDSSNAESIPDDISLDEDYICSPVESDSTCSECSDIEIDLLTDYDIQVSA